MDTKKKPVCRFGSKCYRKNPKHFASYSHPEKPSLKITGFLTKKTDTKKDEESSKKRKIEKGSPQKTKENKLKKEDISNTCEDVNKESENKSKSQKDDDDEGSSDSAPTPSSSWVSIQNSESQMENSFTEEDCKDKSVEEIIKELFMVEMPQDFYSFFEFCKSVDSDDPCGVFTVCELKLVGPFDVLIGKVNYLVDKDDSVCHWRYYYDPPEMQTVLATNSKFHIGYWRDDPKESPVFLASNDPDKDCVFKIEAPNIFVAVLNYLEQFEKKCDPFKKVKVGKLQTSVTKWAEEHEISLEKKSSQMNARQKKVVSKTFHGVGIVVPLEKKTEVGYRPLIETPANLKKICQLIMKAKDDSEREALWENLQPLITAANIANDECDFGNSLELGIDLFCMGSPVFHDVTEHLLTTAYSLLERHAFEKIIRIHLKNREKGNCPSVFY